MFDLFKKAGNGTPESPSLKLHKILIDEAERTGDPTRLMALIITNWSWDQAQKKPNVASAAEFIEHMALQEYKPTSALTQEENQNLSPRQKLICDALDGIQKTGFLEGQMGHSLRHFSETGQLLLFPTSAPEPNMP